MLAHDRSPGQRHYQRFRAPQGRQWGSGNVLITHALADLRSQTDDGTAQGEIAEGLLNTTCIRVFLHQNPEQVTRPLTDLGLTTPEAELLAAMTLMQASWKIGAHTALVDHPVTDAECAFCDTDAGDDRTAPPAGVACPADAPTKGRPA